MAAGRSARPCRRSGGAGAGAGVPPTARQARAGRPGPRRQRGCFFPRFVLPVPAVPHRTVSLRAVVAAAGRASSAERSALQTPAGGALTCSVLTAFQAGGGTKKSTASPVFGVWFWGERRSERPTSGGSPWLPRGKPDWPCAARALLQDR